MDIVKVSLNSLSKKPGWQSSSASSSRSPQGASSSPDPSDYYVAVAVTVMFLIGVILLLSRLHKRHKRSRRRVRKLRKAAYIPGLPIPASHDARSTDGKYGIGINLNRLDDAVRQLPRSKAG